MNDRAEAAPLRWLAGAIVVAVLAFAGWRACTLGMARFWSEARPAAALAWRPAFPLAVYFDAESSIRAHRDAPELPARVRAAMPLAPLDGRGYRFLAHAAETRGDAASASLLYGVAAERGPRDLPSQAWLGDRALARGDYDQALARLDRIMRIEPERMHHLNPVLIQLGSLPKAQPAFARVLARNPPWRSYVLGNVIGRSPTSASVFPLVERLRLQPGGLAPEELRTWLDRLAGDHQWGAAYLTWVQSLSPEASGHIGNIFNGGFEDEPSDSGFDWRFGTVPGAQISRAQTTGAGGNAALRVAFEDRRVPFNHVRQLMALAPGVYRLTGRVRLDDLRTERGLVWTLTCADNGKPIGETDPMSGRKPWTAFSLEFEVPEQDCGGQWLTLRLPARIPAEQRIGGVAWFDDLKAKSIRSSTIHSLTPY